jgi:hypothetical protein
MPSSGDAVLMWWLAAGVCAGAVQEIPGLLDSRTRPLIKFLPGEEMLLSREKLGVFVKLSGSTVARNTVNWNHRPDAVGA